MFKLVRPQVNFSRLLTTITPTTTVGIYYEIIIDTSILATSTLMVYGMQDFDQSNAHWGTFQHDFS